MRTLGAFPYLAKVTAPLTYYMVFSGYVFAAEGGGGVQGNNLSWSDAIGAETDGGGPLNTL